MTDCVLLNMYSYVFIIFISECNSALNLMYLAADVIIYN